MALAVPEPWGGELQIHRMTLGDRPAAGIPTHITLVPPVDVGQDSLPEVEEHLAAAAVGSPAFKVHLRGTGTFRPVSPVVFVVVVEGISRCEQLAFSVRRGPLAVDVTYPYHPHVTVAQDLSEDRLDRAFEELADFECEFEADHFSLYVHDQLTGWRQSRDFPLVAPPGAGMQV